MQDPLNRTLPGLAEQIAALADDVEAGSYVTDPLRQIATDLHQAVSRLFCDTVLARRELDGGGCQYRRRDARDLTPDKQRLAHHLQQAVGVLNALQDGRKVADTATVLRAVAKGIKQAAPKPMNPAHQTKADPPTMPTVPATGKRVKALSKEAKALAALADHPEWTDEQIADAAGCKRPSLYRMKKFVAAKGILKAGKDLMPRGSKDRETGDMEAWDENGGDE